MQAIYSKLLLTTLFIFLFSPSRLINENKHPLHVSTTEIEFNSKEKSLEISCRIFTDDFETVLAKQFKTKTDLTKPSMHKAMDELIKKYMAAHLKLNVNGKNAAFTYIGFELDHEATNVYLEIENINALQKLGLTNSILYDLFDDQMNILHVQKQGVRKSTKTNYPETLASVGF